MTRRHRTTIVRSSILALLLGTVPTVALTASAADAAPYCGIHWGSLAKSTGTMTTAPLVNVRSGQHSCYDRLVVDIAGPAAGYSVQYVEPVLADGSGMPVALRGGARLQVVVKAPAYSSKGSATFVPANRAEVVGVAGYQTFRQVAWAGSFEGQTTLGLGVRARLPYRVFTLAGPGSATRVVIDVAHHW